MEKKSLIGTTILAILLSACNNDHPTFNAKDSLQEAKLMTKDTVPLDSQWNQFILKTKTDSLYQLLDKVETEIPIQSVSVSNAMEGCFKKYLIAVKSGYKVKDTTLNLLPVKNRATRYVYFGSSGVKNWMEKYKVFDNCAELELKFGIYTSEFLHEIHATETDSLQRLGRLGVFLIAANDDGSYATNAGAKIPAYDLGGLYP